VSALNGGCSTLQTGDDSTLCIQWSEDISEILCAPVITTSLNLLDALLWTPFRAALDADSLIVLITTFSATNDTCLHACCGKQPTSLRVPV
jgi:hypothetical protein